LLPGKAAVIRLILADGHPIVLKGLRNLFHESRGFSVVAECGTAAEIVPSVKQHRPDILLIDVRIEERDRFATICAVNQFERRPGIVIFTTYFNEDDVFAAVRNSVGGVVLKSMNPDLLLQCVRKVHSGGQWLEKESIGRALETLVRKEQSAAGTYHLLTNRETEIAKLASAGMTNRKIAEKLFISEGTVKMHLHSVYEKLRVSGRTELMLQTRDDRRRLNESNPTLRVIT
jgi:DNA-binding NarL/FixJ family response regulator